MVVGANVIACFPLELALVGRNGHIVDGGVSLLHQAIFVKQPVLVAVRAEPLALVVVVFVAKAHRNAIVGEGVGG